MGKISNLPEATKVTETDYIVIESEGSGSRKFPVSQLMGEGGGNLIGNIECLPAESRIGIAYTGEMTEETHEVPVPKILRYNWDFTQSLTDSVSGHVATLTNCTMSSEGVSNSSVNGYVTLFSSGINLTGMTVEIDFESFSKNTTSALTRFISVSSDSFLGYSESNRCWICKLSNSQQEYSQTSNVTNVTNATLQFEFTTDHLKVTMPDSEPSEFYEGGTFAPNTNGGLYIGWSAGAFGNFTITGVRIYG